LVLWSFIYHIRAFEYKTFEILEKFRTTKGLAIISLAYYDIIKIISNFDATIQIIF